MIEVSRRTFIAGCAGSALVLIGGSSCRKETTTNRAPIPLGAVRLFPVGMSQARLFLYGVQHEREASEHRFSAVSLQCPHQNCPLSLAQNGFVCPCHGARFALDGSRLSGPTERNMKWLALELSSTGELVVKPDTEVEASWRLIVHESYF